jgi:alcohol dehydrogenase class IV
VSGDFTWRDAGRTVLFRAAGSFDAPGPLAEHGFAEFQLLSTPRALALAPALATAAAAVHEVPPGQVPGLAASLLDSVGPGPLLALGGGRAIDVAKALASVTGAAVAAIPTTMSGAEMTGIHRLPEGAEGRVRALVRPALVLAGAEAMTSQPEPRLRASSMNALAHGADSLYTPLANPVAAACALRGAGLIAAALDQPPGERDRPALALGSLLCGYAIDSAGFGLHHVVCQTLVRVCGTPHAETNARILPGALAILAERAPEPCRKLAAALGTELGSLPGRVAELGGEVPGLGTLGGDPDRIEDAVEEILARPELSAVPRPPGREELIALVESAWQPAAPG